MNAEIHHNTADKVALKVVADFAGYNFWDEDEYSKLLHPSQYDLIEGVHDYRVMHLMTDLNSLIPLLEKIPAHLSLGVMGGSKSYAAKIRPNFASEMYLPGQIGFTPAQAVCRAIYQYLIQVE